MIKKYRIFFDCYDIYTNAESSVIHLKDDVFLCNIIDSDSNNSDFDLMS